MIKEREKKIGGRMLIIGILLLTSGCFPYRQSYRGPVTGVIRDSDRNPLPNAKVQLCSTDGWRVLQGCPRKAETRTDDQGRFAFPEVREWEWCCFGEAPRPATYLTACARGRSGEWLTVEPIRITTTAGVVQNIELMPAGVPDPPPLCSLPYLNTE